VKEHPIIFSAESIRAILDGRKSQTRRIVKPQPQPNGGKGLSPLEPYHTPLDKWTWVLAATGHGNGTSGNYCPYGTIGDRLWVRETFAKPRIVSIEDYLACKVIYKADCAFPKMPAEVDKWTPSIFMPRWASRITLEVTDVRVQRLQDISEEDAIAEGVIAINDPEGDCWTDGKYLTAFQKLWGEINGFAGEPKARASWDSNPFVWCISFKVVK